MKAFIVCLALSLFSISSFAQDHQDKMLQHMTKKLDLNEQQVIEVKNIMEEQKEQRQLIRKTMEDLHASTTEKMAAILTPEQLEKFKQMENKREHKKDKRKERHDQ